MLPSETLRTFKRITSVESPTLYFFLLQTFTIHKPREHACPETVGNLYLSNTRFHVILPLSPFPHDSLLFTTSTPSNTSISLLSTEPQSCFSIKTPISTSNSSNNQPSQSHNLIHNYGLSLRLPHLNSIDTSTMEPPSKCHFPARNKLNW